MDTDYNFIGRYLRMTPKYTELLRKCEYPSFPNDWHIVWGSIEALILHLKDHYPHDYVYTR